MWIFLFVLALVPMCFYWSDSIVELFPGLEGRFGTKKAGPAAHIEQRVHLGPDGKPEESGRWYTAQTDKGYLAWALAADGTYRMAVGCHRGASPSIQLTHTSGRGLGDGLYLNYDYGTLELGASAYAGADLIGAVAQFKTIYLQTRNRAVLAQFDVKQAESNFIARTLLSECAAQADDSQ